MWTVTHVAKNRKQHPGYDEGVGGSLIDAKGLPVSLYDWEFEVIPNKKDRKNVHAQEHNVKKAEK